MRFSRRDLALGAGLVVSLIAAVWAAASITSHAVHRLLYEDAEYSGEAWTRYIAENVDDLDAIVAGGQPSAASRAFFESVRQVGDVFLYRIYDRDGVLRLSSDGLERAGAPAVSLGLHNPAAAEAARRGETFVEAEHGAGLHVGPNATDPIGRETPSFFSEAYVPVVVDGKVLAVVEAYVDQAAKHAAFSAMTWSTATELCLIIALAFLIPAVGLYLSARGRRRADSRADFLAGHDDLTRIPNRANFMHDLGEAAALGCPIAVHAIDIDRFREVNRGLGQAAGDEVLKQIARRLQAVTAKTDLLARLGSDAFAVAEVLRGPGQTTATARRIAAALGEPFDVGGPRVEVSASVGSAMAPVHGRDAPGLLKRAEIALSDAKSTGFGARSLFRPEMDAELESRRALESLLREAVQMDRFELHFQPFFRAADRGLAGFEALLRLPGPEGWISPAVFIPLAERLGLITQIGDRVLHRAAAVAAGWPQDLVLAVNLSPAQFESGRIAVDVESALRSAGLDPARLELEITEGLLLTDTEGMLRQLAALRALGVRIAMDDFGTGYSSLSHLWRYPVDKLKIDQSFVRSLGSDDQLPPVIAAIVSLGRSLRMAVTAEGVETEAQAMFLTEVGCDFLQGFHLGRPMPLDAAAALVLRKVRAEMGGEASPNAADKLRASGSG